MPGTHDAGGGPRPVQRHTHPYGHHRPGTDDTVLSGPAYTGPTATSARHAWMRTGDLWALQVESVFSDGIGGETGTLVNLTTGESLGQVENWDNKEFAFAVGQDEPILIDRFDNPPANAISQKAPDSLTSTSQYNFDSLQLDVAGSGRYAFVANDPVGYGQTFFLWDGSSTPTEFWTIDNGGGHMVLRYDTAPRP